MKHCSLQVSIISWFNRLKHYSFLKLLISLFVKFSNNWTSMASEIMLHDSTLFDKFFSHLLLITMIKAIILEVSKKNLKRTHAVSFRALFNETHATTYAAAIAVTLYCYFPKVKMLLINCNSLLSFFLHIFCL